MVKSYQITALRKYLNDARTISQPELIKLLGNTVTGHNQSSDMEKILYRLLDNWKAEQKK